MAEPYSANNFTRNLPPLTKFNHKDYENEEIAQVFERWVIRFELHTEATLETDAPEQDDVRANK